MATSHSLTDGNPYVSLKLQKNIGRIGGKLTPQDAYSTRLQELSLMKCTYFGAIHYDIHLDIKLDYTISRIFQEMSLSELETLYQLCELERTQILQSLALSVLKIPYAGYLLSGNRSNFLEYAGNIFGYYSCTKKVSPLYVFEDKICLKESPYSTKIKYISLMYSQDEHIFGRSSTMWIRKQPQLCTIKSRRKQILSINTIPNINATIKKFSPESIRALARNPNIDLQSIGIYSKSDIQHHIRTQLFQELFTKMDTVQRQSIDQNIRKIAETAGFQVYTHKITADFLKT